jgi:hypothetical protein
MAGPKATVIDLHDGSDDPGVTVVGRDWTAPGSPDLSFSFSEDKNHIPIAIDCAADKYNAAAPGADSAIEELFRQCVSADFPGTDTTAAEQWMLGNLADFLEHQRKAPHASAGTSIKEFGDGRYVMGTGYLPAYGLDVSIHISGLEFRYYYNSGSLSGAAWLRDLRPVAGRRGPAGPGPASAPPSGAPRPVVPAGGGEAQPARGVSRPRAARRSGHGWRPRRSPGPC